MTEPMDERLAELRRIAALARRKHAAKRNGNGNVWVIVAGALWVIIGAAGLYLMALT